jgi:RHS repeat-associated protein
VMNLSMPRLQFVGPDLYLYGDFVDFANTNIQFIGKWNTNTLEWEQVGSPLNAPVYAVASLNGHLVAGGLFTSAGGNTNANHIAELVDGQWQNLGTGVGGTNYYWDNSTNFTGGVFSLAACRSNLFVGGDFTSAGDQTNANGVALWDGTQWKSIGNGLEAANYELWADGFPVSNTNWVVFSPLLNPIVYTISTHGDAIYVGGEFTDALNPNDADVPAAGVAKATWSEDAQQWTWSDMDGGITIAGGTGPDTVGSVLTTAIMPSSTPGAYDVVVGGEAVGFQGFPNLCPFPGISRWRVGYPQPPALPTITITNPPGTTVYSNVPSDIEFDATASSSYTNLENPYFFVDGVSLASSPNGGDSYTADWSTPTPGLHVVTAIARDDDGLQSKSKSVLIYILDTNNTVTAVDDLYTITAGDPPVTLNVLTNDRTSATGHSLRVVDVFPGPNWVSHAQAGSPRVSFDGSSIVYTVNPNVYGTDQYVYLVTDGVSTNSAYVTIKVRAKPVLVFLNPEDGVKSNAGTSITIKGMLLDYDSTFTNYSLYVNGSVLQQYNPTNINFQSAPTNFAFPFYPWNVSPQTSYAPFSALWSNNVPGFYTFVAAAVDAYGYSNQSSLVTLVITNSSTATNVLVAEIGNLPVSTTTLGTFLYTTVTNGLFDLHGTAWDSNTNDAVSYQVLLHPPGDETTTIANVTPQPWDVDGFHAGRVNNGDLGVCDLSAVANGSYDMELIVRGGGAETNTISTFQLDSNLKIGQFSFSEQDLVLPVNGIPLTVTRTYNSLNPNSGPFGASWSFALNDMDIQLDEQRTDVTVGSATAPVDSEDEGTSGSGLPKVVSIRTGGGWDVTLTLPDGRRVTFPFQPYQGENGVYAVWGSPPGIKATLTVDPSCYFIPGFPSLHWEDSDLSWGNAPIQYHDIKGWTLQMPDGTKYQITRGTGEHVTYIDPVFGSPVDALVYGPPKLTEIDQRSTNKIVINDNGIFNYNPTNALTRWTLFERDSAGRITAIHDPNNGSNGLPVVQYVYNSDTGNLIQVLKLVDRNAGTYTTNKYHYDYANFPHYITSIENGDGIQVAQNFYDDSGRLTAVQDADGNRTQFNHSVTNDSEVVIDRLFHTNTYVYDPRGNVTAHTNALGQVTLMAYDDNNNKTNEIAYLGSQPYATNSYTYDANNFLLGTINPLGFTNGFTYDGYGNVLTNTDARGNSIANIYDSSTGNLIATVDALGHGTTNFYDGNSLMLGSVDAIGTRTTNCYDGSENLIGVATFDVSGVILNTNSFAFDPDGNRTNSVVWRHVGTSWVGATNTYIYDAQNRVVHTIEPDGGTNTVVYNAIGKQQATIDELGRTTSYAYDFQGRLVQTAYPDLTTESSAYDAAGNRVTSTNRAGRVTSYFYNALNRVTNTVYADDTTNTTVYDGVGRVAQAIDARGMIVGFDYDVAGRLLALTNAVGAAVQMISQYIYDAEGNQTVFTDAANHSTTNVFDVLNRQIRVQYANGTTSSTRFDSVGRRVAETNQDGIVTLFGYDGAGRLIAVTNALGKTEQMVTRYQYDEAGNEVSQVDALGRTNLFSYDGLSRRVSHTMPDTSLVEQFGYDLGGNLIYQTNFLGVIITNQYDVLNRLTNRGSVNGYQASFRYNAAGQRTNMTDVSGTTSYSYDNRDRLTNKLVSWAGGPSVSLNYRFDGKGTLTNLWSSTSGGVTNVYQYDALSRLTNVLAGGSAAAVYGFDAVGNLQAVRYGSGVTNQYQYDSLNRLTNLVWKLNASTLASFYYQLGLTGNRTNLSETVNGTSRTYGWQYNNLYQLTNETNSSAGNVSYRFDPVGNRTNRTSSVSGLGNQAFTFNTNDWLTGDNYDKNGNTTNSSGTLYQYDALNHLTNANGGAVLLVYDGDGNRVAKTVSGTTTYYLLDDRNPSGYVQVLEEYQGSSLNRVYNYGLQLVSEKQTGVTSYYGYDGHGSVRFLTDTSGSLTETNAYDAYGTMIASSGSTPNNYLYCGEQYDSNVGMYYLRARYYKPDTGRFWTMDTFEGRYEEPQSLHKYIYGANDPVNLIDPSGHDELVEEEAADTFDLGIDTAVGEGEAMLAMEARQQLVKAVVKNLLIAATVAVAVGGDEDNQSQYVVRGGVATAQRLQIATTPTPQYNVYGVTSGFSVQAARGKSVPELAKGGRFYNLQISVSTETAIREVSVAAGYPVQIISTPSRNSDYHCTVTAPFPAQNLLSWALSLVFVPVPNPYPVK